MYDCEFSGALMVSIFFVKQKTAYEMRISDWSSDVCSSDLIRQIEGIAVNVGLINAVDINGDVVFCASRRALTGYAADSWLSRATDEGEVQAGRNLPQLLERGNPRGGQRLARFDVDGQRDRKSTRLNSSH